MLNGKRIAIMGLFDPDSIAWEAAKLVREYGGEVVFTCVRRGLTEKTFKKAGVSLEGYQLFECDVTSDEQLENTFREIGPIDGLVYSIGYAPEDCLGKDIFRASRENIMKAFDVSSISFILSLRAALPYLRDNSSIVTLTVDSARAYSFYGWMGPAKAALESEARYAAQIVGRGIRVNVISSGPLETRAARHIPGLSDARTQWSTYAPLGWDVFNKKPVAEMTAFLLSDSAGATTGAVLPVDGGFLSVGV
jgi:enoyl-[acyl-carrier protein] reductase I